MKRLVWVVVALAVPVFFAGCGGGGNATFSPQASTSSPSAPGSGGTPGTSGTSGTGASAGTGGTSGTSGTSGTGGTQPTPPTDPDPTPVGTTISNIQTASGNWQSWGQGGPDYVDCSPSPCNGYAWSMKFGITLPSLSNNATEFKIFGTKPYGDALFSAQLIGSNAPQLRDANHSLLPTLHYFTYDTDVYVTDISVTQNLEFDITMYMQGLRILWGTQCDHKGDKSWDIYDNVNKHWVSAGIPCQLVNGWNHVTLHMQRKSDNTVFYQSIELNGTSYPLNIGYAPGTAPSSWWGLTVNYQMDGDSTPHPNTTYLDNFSLTYW